MSTTKTPPRSRRIGFGELARHLGVESAEIGRLCEAGELAYYHAPDEHHVRLITRAAANAYLRRKKLPLVPEEGDE